MSVRHLDALFRPRSVAVIGASERRGRVGRVVVENLLAGGFSGPILPVNPKYRSVCGVLAYPDASSLPVAPDLAVICTPPAVVPRVADEAARAGARAAIVLTAGLDEPSEDSPRAGLARVVRERGLRVLGPNCLGLLVPPAHLDASFAHVAPLEGSIAFISQSGALCTAVLDWARPRGIGFSAFASIGESLDVDFGDLLDWLGSDPDTRSILLYIESITDARKFLSAARAAARNKTVLAIKAGRVQEGARAAASHTGALAGSDEVYDAAIRRAGMLRVESIADLFDAVESLARGRPPADERLAILSNGGGPGVLATDALIAGGGRLVELGSSTIERLDAVLPRTWSRADPVDLIGDADGERYARALSILLEDPAVHTVLVVHVPTAIASSLEAAQAVAEVARRTEKSVLTSWLGGEAADPARRILSQAGLPTHATPEDAVHAFLRRVEYRRNQEMLLETPPSVDEALERDVAAAREIIRAARAAGSDRLLGADAQRLLGAFGIPTVETRVARDAQEAGRIAAELGVPVVLKALSQSISHKSELGGVVLDLHGAEAVRSAAEEMLHRLRRLRPEATIEGFVIQPMASLDRPHELIAGVATDDVFGPVILCGQGGTAVEVIADRVIALPPLNLPLAESMLARTRVHRLLQGYRDRPAADVRAVCLTLVRLSQLVVDLPEVRELDINPLLVDARGVLVIDARVELWPQSASGARPRLAIRPYPRELEEMVRLRDGARVLLRPIRPEDEPAHHDLLTRLDPDDVRFRFFGLVRAFPHSEMARFTQIDYEREMAFIAVRDEDGVRRTLGVVRVVLDSARETGEFAIVVRSDLKGVGLGTALLRKLIRYCRDRGLRALKGQVLEDNHRMLRLAAAFGFRRGPLQDGAFGVELEL